jgi:hypothetical protein
MNEKTRTIVAGAIMLLAQGVVAWAVWLSAWCMARNWSEGLGSVALPLPTDIALRHGQAIPIVAAAFTVITVCAALRRKGSPVAWLLSISLAEILALSLFVVAITMPALTITYSLAP